MPRLLHILSALGLVAIVLLAFSNRRLAAERDATEDRLASVESKRSQLEAELAAAIEKRAALEQSLATRTTDFNTSQQQLAAATARAAAVEGELTRGRDTLRVYEETARLLSQEIGGLRAELHAARLLATSAAAPASRGPAALPPSTAVLTTRPGSAKVLSVGPESAFVVLDFGQLRGASIGQRLSVKRGNDTLALVLISDVRDRFSIAQVLPESLRGVLHKGDSALLLR